MARDFVVLRVGQSTHSIQLDLICKVYRSSQLRYKIIVIRIGLSLSESGDSSVVTRFTVD